MKSVQYHIHWKSVITIQIWFDLSTDSQKISLCVSLRKFLSQDGPVETNQRNLCELTYSRRHFDKNNSDHSYRNYVHRNVSIHQDSTDWLDQFWGGVSAGGAADNAVL